MVAEELEHGLHAMSTSIKQPPVFYPVEDDDYVSWKADIEIPGGPKKTIHKLKVLEIDATTCK